MRLCEMLQQSLFGRWFRWLLRMIKLLIALEDNNTIKWLDFFYCSWVFCLSLAEPTVQEKYINTTNLKRFFLIINFYLSKHQKKKLQTKLDTNNSPAKTRLKQPLLFATKVQTATFATTFSKPNRALNRYNKANSVHKQTLL